MQTELQQVLASIAELSTEFKNLKTELHDFKTEVENKIDASNQKIDNFNEKFDNYQKATQWVVALAFSLIASATVITIISSVFRR